MSAETESNSEAFKRGAKAGQIDEQLRQHGEHLGHINGSVAAGVAGLADVRAELVGVRTELASVRTELGAVVQQMEADTIARLALADALEKADVVRRQQDVDKAEALRGLTGRGLGIC
jgi:hypothetical protein